MKKFELVLEGLGRGFGGFAEVFHESDLIAWKSAAKLLNKIEYSEDTSKITLFFDWSEVVCQAEESYKIESMSKEEFEKWKPTLSELKESHKIYCEVDHCSEDSNTNTYMENRYWIYTLRAIYESFLILNLASPGSFNFLKCEMEDKQTHVLKPSAYFFEDAWHQCLTDGWPEIKFIELSKVINWVRSLKIGDVEFAKSKIERSIYALIHASNHPANELSTIMWIAYALEALYEIPVGRSFTVLFNLISEFLSIPETKNKKIKSQLRKFYDERHKFAHGGSPIVHPIEDYDLDSEAGKYTYKIQMLNAFGFSIALSTIQKCIVESLSGLEFIEGIKGIAIAEKT